MEVGSDVADNVSEGQYSGKYEDGTWTIKKDGKDILTIWKEDKVCMHIELVSQLGLSNTRIFSYPVLRF